MLGGGVSGRVLKMLHLRMQHMSLPLNIILHTCLRNVLCIANMLHILTTTSMAQCLLQQMVHAINQHTSHGASLHATVCLRA